MEPDIAAAHARWNFDQALLQRYDRPGPRYTSYPTAPHFQPGFGATELQAAFLRAQQQRPGRALSLYVHVPFCSSPCFYCGCNRIITRDASKGQAYVARLLREATSVAATPMFFRYCTCIGEMLRRMQSDMSSSSPVRGERRGTSGTGA